MHNILYLLPSYNLYGGTPKKTLDLINHSTNHCILYIWSKSYKEEFKVDFENSKAMVYEGPYGRNIYKHLFYLLKIIDGNNIQLIQAQFTFGESIVGLIKMLRPKVKIVICFVGPFSPIGIKKIIVKQLYRTADTFVYISKYIKREKINDFPFLKNKHNLVIYNGTNPREPLKMNHEKYNNQIIILAVAGLIKIKNIQILINCLEIIRVKTSLPIKFIIAGDGHEKDNLKEKVKEKNLGDYFQFLGYQNDIGGLLKESDIFVHPCYKEGFGIAVAEAMMAEKPIIVSNAGALPELIENEKTGLIVNPFNTEEWANAIIRLIEDKEFAKQLAHNAKKKAEKEFSIEKFVLNYEQLYNQLLN